MAQSNVLKKYLDAGVSFTNMTQSKAEALVKELVKAGELQTEQAQSMVTEVLERSRKNTEAFIDQVRRDIADSAESLGLATIADVKRLEKLIAAIRPGGTAAEAPAKKAPAKKTAAKKSPAKKSAAKKAPAKKTAAKKSPAKKSAAKKAPAKKTAAEKAPQSAS
jgi:polyhydroxyalkanoate synthesis regulator phasin